MKNESLLSSQPSHDVSGSKMYVLFGMNVTMLWSLLQLSTSLNLNSLKKRSIMSHLYMCIVTTTSVDKYNYLLLKMSMHIKCYIAAAFLLF